MIFDMTKRKGGGGVDYSALQYARDLTNAFAISYASTFTYPEETFVVNAPLCVKCGNIFSIIGTTSSSFFKNRGVKKLVLNIGHIEASNASIAYGVKGLEEIEINGADNLNSYSAGGTAGYGTFATIPDLKKITNVKLNGNNARFQYSTAVNPFYGSSKLEEFRFVPNSMKQNQTYQLGQSSHLSDDTLVSIANGMADNTTKVVTLHATPAARLSNIMGAVSQVTESEITYDIFTKDPNGTVTLLNFITQTKGWTVST
jgi:hypothetical protein